MKLILLVLAASFSLIQSASACERPEAQFIGTVSNVLTIPGACYIHVEFSNYQESGICPLNSADVINTWIRVSDCGLKIGDAVSGYLANTKEAGVVLN